LGPTGESNFKQAQERHQEVTKSSGGNRWVGWSGASMRNAPLAGLSEEGPRRKRRRSSRKPLFFLIIEFISQAISKPITAVEITIRKGIKRLERRRKALRRREPGEPRRLIMPDGDADKVKSDRRRHKHRTPGHSLVQFFKGLQTAVETTLVYPLYKRGKKISINETALLIVAWFSIIFGPLMILGFAFVKNFPTTESRVLSSDSAMYCAQIAGNLSGGRGYVTSVVDPLSLASVRKLPDHPERSMPPIYPLVLSLPMSLFGRSDTVVIALSCLLWFVTALLTYRLGFKMNDRRIAALALAFYSLNSNMLRTAFDGGISQWLALLLVIYAGCLIETAKSINAEDAKGEIIAPVSVTPAMVGVIAGLLVFSNYMMILITLPAAVWIFIRGGGKVRASWMVWGFLAVAAPSCVYQWAETGSPFATLGAFNVLAGVFIPISDLSNVMHPPSDSALVCAVYGAWELARRFIIGISLRLDIAMQQAGVAAFVMFVGLLISGGLVKELRNDFLAPLYIGIGLLIILLNVVTTPDPIFVAISPLASFCAAMYGADAIERFAPARREHSSRRKRDRSVWSLDWEALGIRWGLGVVLVVIASVQYVALLGKTVRLPGKPEQMAVLEKGISELKPEPASGVVYISDKPEWLAWFGGKTSARLPVLYGDYKDMVEAIEKSGAGFGGVFLAGSPPGMASGFDACRWLAAIYTPFGLVADTAPVPPSRVGANFRRPFKIPGEGSEPVFEPATGNLYARLAQAGYQRSVRLLSDVRSDIILGMKTGDPCRLASVWLYVRGEDSLGSIVTRWLDVLTDQRNLDVAALWGERLAKVFPRNAEIQARMMRVYAWKGSFSKAEQAYAKARRISPKVMLNPETLALLMARQGKKDQAVNAIRLAAMADQRMGQPYGVVKLREAQRYYSAGLYDHAIIAAEGMLKSMPEAGETKKHIYSILAGAFLRQKQPEKAIQVLQTAIKEFPLVLELHKLLAYAYNDAKMPYEADSTIERIVLEEKRGPSYYGLLSELRTRRGDLKAAIEACRDGLARYPDNVILLNNLAFLYSESDNEANVQWAESTAQALLSKEPDNIHIRDTLAWVLHKLGKQTDAEAVLQPFERLLPGNPTICYHYGVILMGINKPEKARFYLREAVQDAEVGTEWLDNANELLEQANKKPE